jgi:cell division protein FtsI (penicillin-binding protein 3)
LLASALNERTVKNTDYIYCENGHFGVTTRVIHDTHPHKSLSVSEILKYSSNIGAAKIALKMGGETFYDYIRAFGFGRQTGLDVPGETSGILRHWKRWYPIDLAVTGFGQSIGVTALQLTAGIACIANDGLYARPFVVRGIVDNEGRTVKGFGPGPFRRVVDKEVARQVREMMVEVAREGGTGVRAALKDYTVAGKTGTAQVLDPQTGGYSSHKYNSLFTGFVPAEDPRLVISVVVHEPKGENYGGVVAGPVFREIASKVLPYLGVTPSYEPDRVPVKVPWVKVAVVEAAKASGDSSGGYASEASRCNGVFMPDVKGMSLKLALQRIPSDGVRVDLEGKGKVVSQDPAPGTVLKKGMLVKLTLHD